MDSMNVQPYVSSSNPDGLGKLSFKHLVNTNQVKNTKVITHQLLRFLQCIYILIHSFEICCFLTSAKCFISYFLFFMVYFCMHFELLGKSYKKNLCKGTFFSEGGDMFVISTYG